MATGKEPRLQSTRRMAEKPSLDSHPMNKGPSRQTKTISTNCVRNGNLAHHFEGHALTELPGASHCPILSSRSLTDKRRGQGRWYFLFRSLIISYASIFWSDASVCSPMSLVLDNLVSFTHSMFAYLNRYESNLLFGCGPGFSFGVTGNGELADGHILKEFKRFNR